MIWKNHNKHSNQYYSRLFLFFNKFDTSHQNFSTNKIKIKTKIKIMFIDLEFQSNILWKHQRQVDFHLCEDNVCKHVAENQYEPPNISEYNWHKSKLFFPSQSFYHFHLPQCCDVSMENKGCAFCLARLLIYVPCRSILENMSFLWTVLFQTI